ncbi:Fic family protein [Mucilaginibacter sabulilitoris]|uniref:Fic family protein n=1 Tax=Mucilaginibacter sabulilitoris TaxID=1173583 RepID=A0ABZ0TUF0_9SPHI|nr:Fic family protein [Mucilaginibacter sabulilitoris]WPU95703.1 Fic family protein [Mucilaginibacter sabulilitoris]
MYNWQLLEWPNFVYEVKEIQPLILAFAQETGEVSGVIQGLPDDLKQETLLQLMLSEAVKTSEIEGEYISREDVMSSIRNNLGLNETLINVKDQRAGGVTQLLLDVRKSFDRPLSLGMLQAWHEMLMTGARNINPGEWRIGVEPMQIVSGAYGREIIHYEAPPSSDVPKEMERFVQWYNKATFPLKGEVAEAVLKSAVAHLYFESIHPFEDGNGRIGRAISEKALSQSIGRPVMLSLSKIIEHDKATYYAALKEAQRSLDITAWINYFASVILEAQRDAKAMVQFTLRKSQFFDRYKHQLNERQLKAVNKILEKGADGFEGGMTAKKYIGITKTSKATATRDLQELQAMGVLVQEGAGRSIRYQLNLV